MQKAKQAATTTNNHDDDNDDHDDADDADDDNMTAFYKLLRGGPTGGSVIPGPMVEPWPTVGLEIPGNVRRDRGRERGLCKLRCPNQIMLFWP